MFGIPAHTLADLRNGVGKIGIAIDLHVGKCTFPVLRNQRQVSQVDANRDVRGHVRRRRLQQAVGADLPTQFDRAAIETGDFIRVRGQDALRPRFLRQQMIDGGGDRREIDWRSHRQKAKPPVTIHGRSQVYQFVRLKACLQP